MKRQGIAGAMIFDSGSSTYRSVYRSPAGPNFMGPVWMEMFQHAVKEAHRLGLELSITLASGWDCGGQWITAEYASQKVVWSQTRVMGPAKFSEVLPNPPVNAGFYRDIAVQAMKLPDSSSVRMTSESSKLTVSSSESEIKYPATNMLDDDHATFWVSGGIDPGEGPTSAHPEWIQLEFQNPFAASALYLAPRHEYGPRRCELQYSEDGQTFKTIISFEMERDKSRTVTFNEVNSRIFRLHITSSYDPRFPNNPRSVQITEIRFLQKGETYISSTSSIKNWALKSVNRVLGGSPKGAAEIVLDDYPESPEDAIIKRDSILDISSKMEPNGRLTWDVSKGHWVILRFGHTTTGRRMSSYSPGGGGYMLDHLSTEAMKLHYENMGEKLIRDAGDLVAKSLTYFQCDSWEVGAVNWTPKFREEFKQRRGYDLFPYLPVLAKKIVDSREISNRFLYDFRKTISDCIADNHYGTFQKLCHRRGISYHAEAGGPHAAPIDALKCLGRTDVVMGEFWAKAKSHRVHELDRHFGKQTAVAAHIYGTKVAQAEAFTTIGPHWERDPFMLKEDCDRAFCEGLNQYFLHQFTLSPPEVGRPGYEYFAGTHFNPNITWWEQIDTWIDYLSRCQFLLQQGLFVGDVCYYYGDNVPNFVGLKHDDLNPDLPTSYDYDMTNAEVLLTRMSVKNGRIVLPDGMSYHILVLPQHKTIPPEVLRKIIELVKDGATVVGPKPSKAPGLRDYPHCDEVVKKLADQLWGPGDGTTVKEHHFGKGRIIWSKALREILLSDGVKPDFEYTASRADSHLDFIHRTTGDTEIYFVANRKDRWEQADCTFRVKGKVPELWRPDTGEQSSQVVYDTENGRNKLPLRLAPYGSVFVVFRKPSLDKQVVSVVRNDKSIFPVTQQEVGNIPSVEVLSGKGESIELRVWQPGKYVLEDSHGKVTNLDIETVPAPLEIAGPWVVHFPEGWGAPESKVFDKLISWTQDPEPGIKYFSGTAIYQKSFNIPPELVVEDKHLVLDLGEVKNIAEVTLNGKNLGVLWKKPFRADITDAVKPGPNVLEVEITNLWPNRLIGDQYLPEDQRFTHTNVIKFKKDSPLLDSGLLGPVRMITAKLMMVDSS